MRLASCAGVADVLAAKAKAATPVTCGVAMEVPLMVLVAVDDVNQVDVIELPGANKSRQLP